MANETYQNPRQNNFASQSDRNTSFANREIAPPRKQPAAGLPSSSSEKASSTSQDASSDTSEKKIKTVKELLIWQKSLVLVKQIYKITRSFPREEIYGIVSQMKRSAISIPSNIAEGFRRRHAKEFKQFLNIALGSLAELETQVLISGELAYLTPDVKNALLEQMDHLTAMMICLSKKM